MPLLLPAKSDKRSLQLRFSLAILDLGIIFVAVTESLQRRVLQKVLISPSGGSPFFIGRARRPCVELHKSGNLQAK